MAARGYYASLPPLAVAGLWVVIACASPPVPEPESAAQKGAEASARAAAETLPPDSTVREKIVVVEEGGASTAQPSLGEAAAAARADRAAADLTTAEPQPPPRRITNENLAEVGRTGRVSFAGPDAGAPLAGSAEATPATAAPIGATTGTSSGGLESEEPRDEIYWRRTARDLRTEWRQTVDEIATLRERTADLRWRFYAEDDPWIRDSRIKPEWDAALDRLRRAERDVEGFRARVDALLEEGRREGALPGWLREGIELEPTEEEPDAERNPAEPIDPVVVDERGKGNR